VWGRGAKRNCCIDLPSNFKVPLPEGEGFRVRAKFTQHSSIQNSQFDNNGQSISLRD
jgi:hypothetical protein